MFGLDQENYQYAYVSGYSTDYAWLLAREKEVDEQRLEDFKEQLRSAGFAVENLIEVQQ